LRVGFGTLLSRLPGGHRASSLTPLIMIILKTTILFQGADGKKNQLAERFPTSRFSTVL
jgi:hypothetical protein